jgi:hypothetical protein
MSNMRYTLGRVGRDLLADIRYPFWCWSGYEAPDNHVYKKRRLLRIARQFSCATLLETGTYYGQMVRFGSQHFSRVISIEIYDALYQAANVAFAACPKVHLIRGDSASSLPLAIERAEGRILFWLDGHYSGAGTGRGEEVSPALKELDIIKRVAGPGHCIVIDDRRLFVGAGGYPTYQAVIESLKEIDPQYDIANDRDAIIALPNARHELGDD